MNLNKLISKSLRTSLNEAIGLDENLQLADKVYFRTGKLSDEDKEIILSITNGNNYTKLISDFYYYYKNHKYYSGGLLKNLKLLYDDVLNYNKNVYPIIGYNINNPLDISEMILGLERRRKIIEEIRKLPSVALRNLKGDMRQERSSHDLDNYLHDIQYFMVHYSQLSNRPEDIQIKIAKKMFKGNTTLKELMRFTDEKENFIGGVEFTRDDIKELSKTEDFEIIYEQGNSMIVRVDSPEGIKAIGCNSLWCFTYGSGFDDAYRQWNNYSHNDMVYVLIDFRESSDSENFMYVLIRPLTNEEGKLIKYNEDNEDEQPIYDMSNENYSNPYNVLNDLFGPNYKKIIKTYLNFEY